MTEEIKELNEKYHRSVVLEKFKDLCETHDTPQDKARLRDILHHTPDKRITVRRMIKDDQLSDDEIEDVVKWIEAFLHKVPSRKVIPRSVKIRLLDEQDWKCPYCGNPIDEHDHADHIIPFLYVGDELGEENLQMLCVHCNEVKKARTDFALIAMVQNNKRK